MHKQQDKETSMVALIAYQRALNMQIEAAENHALLVSFLITQCLQVFLSEKLNSKF